MNRNTNEKKKISAFDKVIGYDSIKTELLQICDMIHNRDVYEALGAKLPHGVLLYGAPGLGKTLMAKCFIEESGLEAFVMRRDKGSNDFINEITDMFRTAKEKAPCIVFLDDLDKFANEDMMLRDAEEYVAVQAGIDEVKNSDVFVLATVNKKGKLPDSLLRTGRFDKKIEVQCPTDRDANEIIAYYLSDKKVSESVNVDDLTKMISYSSCAELETILNEAAINAAYRRKTSIGMEDLIKAVLRMQYDSPDNNNKTSDEDMKRTAMHEAGHLVVSEVLCPGSVGLASLRCNGINATGGFVKHCKEFQERQAYVFVALAGKAAVELNYSETCANGCRSDIQRAFQIIQDEMESGTYGFGMIDMVTDHFCSSSENMYSRNEAATYAELERFMVKTRDILLKNRVFLEKAADALLEKGTLLASDIKAISDSVTITAAAS